MKPIVDGIENEYQNQLIVQRVNIQDNAGKSLAQKYGFLATPTFILFDAEGKEVWRSIGNLSREKVKQFLDSIQ